MPSYSFYIEILQYSAINISICTRHNTFKFSMYTVYVAGNYLAKFDLISYSHLLDIGCQSWPNLTRGVKEKKYSQKGHINFIFLLHFLIDHRSIDKCSKNLNGVFCFKDFTVCQKWSFFGIASCNHGWYLTDLLP